MKNTKITNTYFFDFFKKLFDDFIAKKISVCGKQNGYFFLIRI